jgi:hypothetical protein
MSNSQPQDPAPQASIARFAIAAFAVASLLAAEPVFALCADVDGNGRIAASDALGALNLALDSGYSARADIAAAGAPDGSVTSTDALAILMSAVAGDIPGCAAALENRVIATTASCDFATGGLTEVATDSFEVVRHKLGVVDADSVIRKWGDRFFVLNRFRGSSVVEIDPSSKLEPIWGCSVGAGSNPHDIAVVSDTKAYVSRYDATTLAIVDLSRGPGCKDFTTGTIDLSPYADADGVPEMDQMVIVGDRLFVAIQRLDRNSFFRPAGAGALVVINITNDEIADVIELEVDNPFVESKGLVYDEASERIYVGSPGDLFTDLDDGGIELVDPDTLTSAGVVISGTDFGGDLTDFALVGSSRGYAVVAGENFEASVVEFDLTTRTTSEALATSPQLLSDIETTESGALWLADRHCSNPGFRVFDIRNNTETTSAPIYPGLTPFNLVFGR